MGLRLPPGSPSPTYSTVKQLAKGMMLLVDYKIEEKRKKVLPALVLMQSRSVIL